MDVPASGPPNDSTAPLAPDPVTSVGATGGPPERPRFGILHLMLWTALSALLLANQRQAIQYLPAGATIGESPWQLLHWALFSALEGAALMSLPVAVAWWTRRIRFPVYPGEWLWLFQGCLALFGVFRLNVEFRFIDQGWAQLPSGIVGLGLSVLPLIVLVAARLPRRWRAYLLLVSVDTFWEALRALVISFQRMIGGGYINLYSAWVNVPVAAVNLLATMGVAAIDGRRAGHLPWTHWLPLLIAIAQPLLTMVANLMWLVVGQ